MTWVPCLDYFLSDKSRIYKVGAAPLAQNILVFDIESHKQGIGAFVSSVPMQMNPAKQGKPTKIVHFSIIFAQTTQPRGPVTNTQDKHVHRFVSWRRRTMPLQRARTTPPRPPCWPGITPAEATVVLRKVTRCD